MNPVKLVAVICVVAGILALAYGGFTYTQRTAVAKVGSVELTVPERKSVNVPIWAGLGIIVLGGVLLVAGRKK
jgi:TRAP-type C4-dicarboxylate transport system permease small subunit